MPIEYLNRKGDRYFLLQGSTKTGKPKYYAARKTGNGIPMEKMPEEYEFYEHPEQGLVFVRKIRSTQILPAEREELTAWIREFAGTEYFILDVQDDSLVVYTPGSDPTPTMEIYDPFLGTFPARRANTLDWLTKKAAYMAMFRFRLVDEEKRLFALDRWCFKGSIDRWVSLAGGQSLEKQARKFLPHLAKESFFELF